MSKKNRNDRNGLVYSTDPDFEPNIPEEKELTLPPEEQRLRIHRDRKGRKGKEVTLIAGFRGGDSDLQQLAKILKSHCGVGGSAKEGEILLQGDQREKSRKFLIEKGYKNTKLSGG